MEQSTLQEILGVERQLHEELDAERQRANAWLEAERRGIDAALDSSRALLGRFGLPVSA